MIEGRIPPRRGGMALLASLREVRLYALLIGGALEVLQMAAHASRVCTREVVIVVNVALGALNGGVCS